MSETILLIASLEYSWQTCSFLSPNCSKVSVFSFRVLLLLYQRIDTKKDQHFIGKYPHCPQSPFASASSDHKLCVGVCFGADFRKKGQWRRNGKAHFNHIRRRKGERNQIKVRFENYDGLCLLSVLFLFLSPFSSFLHDLCWSCRKIFRPIASDVRYESLQKQTHKSIWQDTIHHLARQKFCEGRSWKI